MLAPAETRRRRPSRRVLVDQSPFAAQQGAPLRFGEGAEVEDGVVAAAIEDFAAVGVDLAGEAVEQGGLARTGLADDAENLAGPEIKGDVAAAQRVAVVLGEVANRKQRRIVVEVLGCGGGYEIHHGVSA